MSSFRKRSTAHGQDLPLLGARISAYNGSILLSTGVASLDDILGGGCPLGSLLLLEEDRDTSYVKLLVKYWIAQGLACANQQVILVSSGLDNSPQEIVSKLPCAENAAEEHPQFPLEGTESTYGAPTDNAEETLPSAADESMKIAFRYESLKKFETSVNSSDSTKASLYCSTFDLTKTMHISESKQSRLNLLDIETFGTTASAYFQALQHLEKALQSIASRSACYFICALRY